MPSVCPFHLCQQKFPRKRAYRSHLRLLKISPDRRHPLDDDTWDTVEVKELLVGYTRPKDLSKEEKAERQKESRQRFYTKHRDDLLKNQTESRTQLKDQANRASALANLCRAKSRQIRFLDSKVQHHASLLRQMNPSSPRFIDWIDMLNPVDDETFPRFVTYFLPYNAWPSAALADSEPPMYVSIIPGRTQYMAVCSAIDLIIDLQRVGTPPHHLPDDTRSTLDAGWAIWRDVVEDVIVRDLLCPGEGEEPEFDDQSEIYAALVRLYSKWLEVTSNAAERLIPLGVSMFDLETTGLEVTDGHQVQAMDASMMEEGEDEEALIAAALQYPQQTNGAVGTRGRRTTVQ